MREKLRRRERKLYNGTKFVICMSVGCGLLLIFMIGFMYFGAEKILFSDLWNGLFCFDEENFNHIVVRDMRLPRLLADIMVGSLPVGRGCGHAGEYQKSYGGFGNHGNQLRLYFCRGIHDDFFARREPLGAYRLFLSRRRYFDHDDLPCRVYRQKGDYPRKNGAFGHGDFHPFFLDYLRDCSQRGADL